MEPPSASDRPPKVPAYRPAYVTDPFARPRYPSLVTRVATGVLIFLGVFVVLVVLPPYIVHLLSSNGIPISFSAGGLVYAGVLLAILAAAYYALRPTIAYGPIGIATNIVELAYLYAFYLASPYRFSLSGLGGSANEAVTVGLAAVLLILAIGSVIDLARNATITIRDLRRPGERLWRTYPVR
ncbi:MAG: hypothetical protein M1126_01785 [Candidatus Thermoplasmatota archaeon]|jgi:hypothetical protein|nr:hypothetical protein [Candidatus Thermoplasmatota archaeon]